MPLANARTGIRAALTESWARNRSLYPSTIAASSATRARAPPPPSVRADTKKTKITSVNNDSRNRTHYSSSVTNMTHKLC